MADLLGPMDFKIPINYCFTKKKKKTLTSRQHYCMVYCENKKLKSVSSIFIQLYKNKNSTRHLAKKKFIETQ